MTNVVISLVPDAEGKERLARAKSALDEFFKDKHPGPLPRTAWMGEGYVEAMVFNNRLHLAAVFVMPDKRESRLGAKYLQAFLEVADKHGVEVECSVKPFGHPSDKKPGVSDLTRWYKKNGFKAVPNRKNFLVRPAKPVA